MKLTWYVYEVDMRSQSQPNTVVSSQMWHKARPWPWTYRLGLHHYDHPLCIMYAKHHLYVWSGPDMCRKWTWGSNHNLTVWWVPRCDTQPGPDSGHTGWGGILYDHPLHKKYSKHHLYVWSGPNMCMKWIGGTNHNRTVWLVPRCETRLDPGPGPGPGHTGWGCILMTIHCI